MDSVAKLTQERIAQANGRLRSANVGLSILMRNQRLYLRGTLPPKPGSMRSTPHQQEISLGYLGIRANPAGVSAAEREARRLGVALQERTFDWREHLKPQAIQKLGLEIWDKYTAYKEKTIARTTLLSTYAKTRTKLVKWGEPISNKLDAYRFRDWLLETGCQPVTARKYLINLNACFQWAVHCGLADQNPFEGITQGLKVTPLATPEPFSQVEVQEILQAFKNDRFYSYYYPYVRFLFLTGARPEEAVALCWHHINWETNEINFCEAVNTALLIRKDTKTGKSRLFPMGKELRELLQELWTPECDPQQPVFLSKEGHQLNHANFTRRAWHGYTNRHGKWIPGVVMRLVEAGKVKNYREPYAMRDTFISHCVVECGLHPVQVATWVGNSPDVIFKHYAGVVKRVEVPKLGF